MLMYELMAFGVLSEYHWLSNNRKMFLIGYKIWRETSHI